MDLISSARQLLKISSTSEEGNEAVVNFLIPTFEEMGAKIILQQVPHSLFDHSKRQWNILAILGDDLVDNRTKKGLLLTAPLDTTCPGDPNVWTKASAAAQAKTEDYLYGLGAASGKLSLLAMIEAAKSFAKQKLQRPLYIAGTCGGESPLAGTKYLIQSGALNPKYVVVGRPSNLRLQIEEKTQMVFQIRISYVTVERDAQEFNAKVFLSSRTKSLHCADEQAPQNALSYALGVLDRLVKSPIPSKLVSLSGIGSLYRMPDQATVGIVVRSKDLDDIRNFFRTVTMAEKGANFDLRLGGTGDRGVKVLPDDLYKGIALLQAECQSISEVLGAIENSHYTPNRSRVVISRLQQEKDHIDLHVQFQLLPEMSSVEDRKELENDFKKRVAALAANFSVLTFDCRKILSTANTNMDPHSTFIRTLQTDLQLSGLDSELAYGNSGSEAPWFWEKGYDTVVFGPGVPVKEVNVPLEKVAIADLKSSQRFYSRAIEAFCHRGI